MVTKLSTKLFFEVKNYKNSGLANRKFSLPRQAQKSSTDRKLLMVIQKIIFFKRKCTWKLHRLFWFTSRSRHSLDNENFIFLAERVFLRVESIRQILYSKYKQHFYSSLLSKIWFEWMLPLRISAFLSANKNWAYSFCLADVFRLLSALRSFCSQPESCQGYGSKYGTLRPLKLWGEKQWDSRLVSVSSAFFNWKFCNKDFSHLTAVSQGKRKTFSSFKVQWGQYFAFENFFLVEEL